jgi:hypothetical protein
VSYALGWVIAQTPNGSVVWHDGGTTGFGAFIGMLVDKDVGVIVLSNEQNKGLPDAIGLWALDRLLDNPIVDHVADKLKEAAKGRGFEPRRSRQSLPLFEPPTTPVLLIGPPVTSARIPGRRATSRHKAD